MTPLDDLSQAFDQWGLVEIMGHVAFAGHITSYTIAGCGFVRIDVPETKAMGSFTKIFGTGSIYGITPLDEETARAKAEQLRKTPLDIYDMRSMIRKGVTLQLAKMEEDKVDGRKVGESDSNAGWDDDEDAEPDYDELDES